MIIHNSPLTSSTYMYTYISHFFEYSHDFFLNLIFLYVEFLPLSLIYSVHCII